MNQDSTILDHVLMHREPITMSHRSPILYLLLALAVVPSGLEEPWNWIPEVIVGGGLILLAVLTKFAVLPGGDRWGYPAFTSMMGLGILLLGGAVLLEPPNSFFLIAVAVVVVIAALVVDSRHRKASQS